MDPKLIGCWLVKGIDMGVGRTVSLLAGTPGEYVEFTSDGRYIVDIGSPDSVEYRYTASEANGLGTLDVWSRGLESMPCRCVYQIDGDVLSICMAGNSGERPAEMRRDDDLLWCVKTVERAEPPKRRSSSRRRSLLSPARSSMRPLIVGHLFIVLIDFPLHLRSEVSLAAVLQTIESVLQGKESSVDEQNGSDDAYRRVPQQMQMMNSAGGGQGEPDECDGATDELEFTSQGTGFPELPDRNCEDARGR